MSPGRAADHSASEIFARTLHTRHDPARMQFRLIRGTAVVTDEILAEEHPDGLVITYHEASSCR